MRLATDGEADTVDGERKDFDWTYHILENPPRRDPVTLRLTLPSKAKIFPQKLKKSALIATDLRTGERFKFYSDMVFVGPGGDPAKILFPKGKLRALIRNFPHVLWD